MPKLDFIPAQLVLAGRSNEQGKAALLICGKFHPFCTEYENPRSIGALKTYLAINIDIDIDKKWRIAPRVGADQIGESRKPTGRRKIDPFCTKYKMLILSF